MGERQFFYDADGRLAEVQIARLRRESAETEAEMPVVFWGLYGLGGLTSWLTGLPWLTALVGGAVAAAYWLRNKHAARSTGGAS